MLDIYDWILSPAIRDYLRANYSFSTKEKSMVICCGCRPLDEKYSALRMLLEETESQEDQSMIAGLLGLYDWAFNELRQETPGQVFAFYADVEYSMDIFGGKGNVLQMLRTYDKIMEYMEDYESETKSIKNEAYIEKWAPIDGEMVNLISFKMFDIHGKCCITHFRPSWDGWVRPFLEQRGISWDTVRLLQANCEENPFPLPFKIGDLVRLELPNEDEPRYGVVNYNNFINFKGIPKYGICMAYMEDSYLKWRFLTDWNVDTAPYCQMIDWLHPAIPSELPVGQKLLVELSDYLHRLADHDPRAAEERFVQLVSSDTMSGDGCPVIPRTHVPENLENRLARIEKDDGAAAAAFYETAKRFCEQIGKVRIYDETNVEDLLKVLVDLYSKFLYLPKYDSIACDSHITHNLIMKLHQEVPEGSSTHHLFRETGFDFDFSKLNSLADEKVSDILDGDMYDLYPMLSSGMLLYEHGYVEYAIWEWSHSLHWDDHIMSAISQLHKAYWKAF